MNADTSVDTLTGRALDLAIALLLGYRWWRSSETGRRCLYAPGKNPFWMQTPADGSEEPVAAWDHPQWLRPYSNPDCHGLPLVLAWLREHGWVVCINQLALQTIVALKRAVGAPDEHWVAADTLPEAVARAALKAGEVS